MSLSVIDQRFQVEDVVSKGVSGGVYRAKDLKTGKQVAVKLLYVPPNSDPNFGTRIRREAQVLFELQHPNIVHIIQSGLTGDGVLYYAMEFISGRNLQQVLQFKEKLTPLEAADILDQIAAALDAAHNLKIIHRDVTPSNIMLEATEGGREVVKLIDFGFAKDLRMGGIQHSGPATGRLRLGVAAFMSPEVLAGKPATPRSDVHALAVTLFVCLTGVHPFERDHEVGTIGAVLEEPPPSFASVAAEARLSPLVEEVLRKALAKKPSQRPASAGELAAAFRAAIARSVAHDGLDSANGPATRARTASRPSSVVSTFTPGAGAAAVSAPPLFPRARPPAAAPNSRTNAPAASKASVAATIRGAAETPTAIKNRVSSTAGRDLAAPVNSGGNSKLSKRPASVQSHPASRAAAAPLHPAFQARHAPAEVRSADVRLIAVAVVLVVLVVGVLVSFFVAG